MSKRAIIISISSDIGLALANYWSQHGWEILGSYRTRSPALDDLQKRSGIILEYCDLSNTLSINQMCHSFSVGNWDSLILAPGYLEPIGRFDQIDFDAWEQSLQINLVQQLRIVHHLLPFRRISSFCPPTVLFFAGGGTNNAVLNYSSYTLSKIALIKMVELLAAELTDTRFVILGPGCVKTKIHEPTLRLGEPAAGANYARTLKRLAANDCTPMQDVVDCCDWLVTSTCSVLSGRNFSVVGDPWSSGKLEEQLLFDPDMYKLRRHSNNWRPISSESYG